MTTTDAPEPDRPETPGQSVDGEREKQAHAVVHGMRRWRGLVFVGTSLAALAAGAVLVQGAGRRDTRASASGLPVAAPEAGAGSLRLPPDVLREYQAQIAALASERTRAREGERRVHADHEALAALEMARLEQERRLQRLEERSVRPTPVLPEAREEVSAAGVDHQRSSVDPLLTDVVAPATGEPCAIGVVRCVPGDLRAIIAAVAPICARTPDGAVRWDVVGFLMTRTGVIARSCVGIARPQAALIEAIHADIERYERMPHPAGWSDGTDNDQDGATGSTAHRNARLLLCGALLARAQTDGGWSPERLHERFQSAIGAMTDQVLAACDPTHAHQFSASVLALHWLAPVVPVRVREALDADLDRALKLVLPGRPATERQHAQECAGVQAAAGLLAWSHQSTSSALVPSSMAAATLRDAVRRAAAQAQALEGTALRIRDRMIPDFATLFGGLRRNWSSEGVRALEAASVAVEAADGGLVPKDAAVPASDEVLGASMALCADAAAETVLAQTACGDLVDDALGRLDSACSRIRLEAARASAGERIRRSVTMPMVREDLVRTAVSIAHDAAAMARGIRRIPPVTSASAQAAAISPPSSRTHAGEAQVAAHESPIVISTASTSETAPVPDMRAGTLMHGRSATSLVRTVVIPAGSYADARVLVGVVCELGVPTSENMLVSLDGWWEVPSGGRVRMRDMRVVAECSAYNGNRRVHARIVRLSLDPPGHAQITVPATGWLSDNVIGAGGVLAQGWDWNPDVVIPLAGAEGILSALAGALKPTQQVTSVNVSTTVVDQEHQSPGTKAAGTAAQSLSDGASQQLDRILTQLRPALVVPNNQEVTVVLSEDAVLPVPIDEWEALIDHVDPVESGPGRGFSH